MEERCLLAVYGEDDRTALAAALRASLADLEDPEMRALADSTASKLDGMTDEEIEALDLVPELDFDSEDEETEG